MASTINLHLKTSGLHCRSCSMLIDMTLDELDGVETSATDHATGDTRVSYDPDTVDVQTIIGAIRAVGYDAEPA
ncbi:MAG: heavy-metal-associated domain-containing protein [Coriobacteriia bacterium]|nr:heavy-metal-associated domain-containing protein [Coriobacteriia bacterium]